MTHNSRRQAVLTELRSRDAKVAFDALLISALPNIHYLCGFTGSNGLLLLSEKNCTLITDPRYTLQASQEADCEVRIAQGPLTRALAGVLKRRRWNRLAFERNRISFETYDALRGALAPKSALIPVSQAVEDVRLVKDETELEKIRSSVQTNSRAFRRALKGFRGGMRESELAAEIDHQQRRAGASGPAFSTIVASGARSALPHAHPTREKIPDKGILLIDMGCFEDCYASDMTRTLHVGKAPKRLKSLYSAVLEAQMAAIEAVRPGVTAAQVDAAARRVLTKAGYGAQFLHSTGHGLGLEIHEDPRIGKNSKTILKAGFAITIEPGAYLEGFGGVRIEDTVLVTASGCEVLTPTPKELEEL